MKAVQQNIDKQALREELSNPAIGSKDHLRKLALSLLDELDFKEEQRANWFQMAQKLGEDLDAAERHIAETDHDNAELTAKIELMDRRIAELERSETQLINERDYAESALNDAYKAVMGQAPEWSNWFSFENAIDEIELACELWRNQTDDVIQFRQRIQELEAREITLPQRLQPGADGYDDWYVHSADDGEYLKADDVIEAILAAGIGVKQQKDSVDSDVGSRNQPGMVVAVHIGAGDFVKVKGQVFEVEETDFDDHDVTLWFAGGNALKCSASCQVEVVSEPVAAGIKVKGE
ncbi:ead/Ea22-like family protein [Salmonella enterica subsp. enterica serovar Saintpaul]|nr:ead/Ea22-like family protein [Salmonella enterica subsp. enterica serovar Saintpaul]